MTTTEPCPYPWCAHEEALPCRRGGHTVTHFGPLTRIETGDDHVSVQVIGDPAHGTADDVYVEITTAECMPSGKHQGASTFLTSADTDELVAALCAARVIVAGRPG